MIINIPWINHVLNLRDKTSSRGKPWLNKRRTKFDIMITGNMVTSCNINIVNSGWTVEQQVTSKPGYVITVNTIEA